MPKPLLSWLLLLILATAGTQAMDAVEIEAPKVLLTGLPVDIAVTAPGAFQVRVLFERELRSTHEGTGKLLLTDLSLPRVGELHIEVTEQGDLVTQQIIPVVPAWISLLPPAVAICLAFLIRSVIPSLFVGILAGAWVINGMSLAGAFAGLFDVITVYVVEAIIDPGHAAILVFTLLIGGMVGVISRNGGMVGAVNLIVPHAHTPRRGQVIIAALGLGIFFDDYSNTLIVGNASRPISDRLHISREKLAYLVDSTAAPVATVAVITTWIGFQVGLIQEAADQIDAITPPAYALFLNSIPYSFYPFLALFLVFLVVFSGRDFGPMYRAEVRARSTGEVSNGSGSAPGAGLDEFDPEEGIPCRGINALLPIVTLIGGVIGGMAISGKGDTLQDILGSADAYAVLMWASLLACLVAAAMTLSQRLLTLEETMDAWMVGARFMLNGLALLVLAWAIADVTNILQASNYLISLVGDQLTPQWLPALVFLLSAIAAFATGTSWGVMAVMMPLVIPLAWAVMENAGMANPEGMYILYASIASVLTGSVWADHCSPIADTTVLSSVATGCNHMDHVFTQIPYALLGGSTALLICAIPVGFGLPWWLLIAAGTGVIALVHLKLGRSADVDAAAIVADRSI